MNKVLDQIYSDDVEAVVDFPHSFFFEHFYRKWPNAKVSEMLVTAKGCGIVKAKVRYAVGVVAYF